MNAVYSGQQQQQLYIYDVVNFGYALAIDEGLKVPVFKNTDTMDLDTIMAEKDKFIEKYVSHELASEDMEVGTFTITDLSSSGSYKRNFLTLSATISMGLDAFEDALDGLDAFKKDGAEGASAKDERVAEAPPEEDNGDEN